MKPRAPFAALSLPLASLAAADGARQQPVVLIPDGQFAASDGRPQGLPGWQLDAAIAARLIRGVQGRKTKLVVNYEHAEPSGAPLPAAGWIDPASLAYVPGTGLTAQVDWLPKARDMLAQGEYAYLSPVIRYDATSGAVLDLLLANASRLGDGIREAVVDGLRLQGMSATATAPSIIKNDDYLAAMAGGPHAGWLKNARATMRPRQLRKAIASFARQIELHRGWIANPASKPGMEQAAMEEVARCVREKWPDDIRRLTTQRNILLGLLEEIESGKGTSRS